MGRMCVSTVGVVQSKKHCRLDGGIPSSTHCPPMRPLLSLPFPPPRLSTRPSSLQSQPHNNPRRTKSLKANQETEPAAAAAGNPTESSGTLRLSARTETVPLGRLKRGGGRLEEEGTLFELRRKGGSRRKAGGAAGGDMKPASVCFASLCVLPFSRFALSDSKPNATPPVISSTPRQGRETQGGPVRGLPGPGSPPKDPVRFLARFGQCVI